MGWWANEDETRWGDGPADALDAAIEAIDEQFARAYGRPATDAELRNGLDFSLGGRKTAREKKQVRGAPRSR